MEARNSTMVTPAARNATVKIGWNFGPFLCVWVPELRVLANTVNYWVKKCILPNMAPYLTLN
jgi:hypothetical protein